MVSFEGKVAIVTGASGGMGRAIAEGFAAAGAAVVAADIAADEGKAVVDAIVQAGGTASFVATDVSDGGSVEAMVRQVVDAHGRLDCAVNAAAIEGEPGPLADVEDERFDKIIAVNLRSVFLCMKHEIRAMLANGGGAIVNIASTNSYRPQPRQAAYTASKHGVLGITRSAAIDYAAQGIRINAICPGAIDTPMLREAIARRGGDERTTADRLSLIGRFGRPDEIAKAAMWLCSDDASYTYGHALAVDAGYLAR
jgi:glucose 1-dehydrogenase